MTIIEFYHQIGGSYEEILNRFVKEDRIIKFVKLFKSDPSYNNFLNAIDNLDYEEAFRAIHTLKGISLNLSFDKLSDIACKITEIFRHYNNEPYQEEIKILKQEYQQIINAIDHLD